MEPKKKGSGLSIAAMVLGIVGLVLSCIYIGVLPCAIGLIFAIIAMVNKSSGKGMAIAGLVTSIVGIVIFFMIIISQIATDDTPKNSTDDKPGTETSSDNTEPTDKEDSTTNEPVIEYVNEDEIKLVYTDTDKYEGKHVKLYLQLIRNPEYAEDGVYFQGFADIENSDLNTLVQYADNTLELTDGDYVYLDGEITGSESGYNAFGGEVNAVTVVADTVEKVSYIEAVSPTIKEFTGITPIEQNGCMVTIDKVEVSPIETRVYVTVTNSSNNEFHIYDFNARIVQNGTQYEPTYNFEADYEELQSDILSGVTSSGVSVFDKIDESSGFDLIIEGYSDNYSIDFEDYQFTIK